jgi:hypothetical protein
MIFSPPYKVVLIDDDSILELLKIYMNEFESYLVDIHCFTTVSSAMDFI